MARRPGRARWHARGHRRDRPGTPLPVAGRDLDARRATHATRGLLQARGNADRQRGTGRAAAHVFCTTTCAFGHAQLDYLSQRFSRPHHPWTASRTDCNDWSEADERVGRQVYVGRWAGGPTTGIMGARKYPSQRGTPCRPTYCLSRAVDPIHTRHTGKNRSARPTRRGVGAVTERRGLQ